MPAIQLQLTLHQTIAGLPYQHLHIQITTPNGVIEPNDLRSLTLPEGIVWSHGIVIEGRAPIWLYGCLIHACHPAIWVACFDPRLGDSSSNSGGAVIVATHSPQFFVGDVLKLVPATTMQEQTIDSSQP